MPKNGAMKSFVIGTMNKKAHSPYTTEGTPANTSIKGLKKFRNFFGAYSEI